MSDRVLSTTAPTWLPSQRLINGLGFIACAGLLGFAYFLQYYQDLEPCPLCIFQRLAIFAIGVVFALAALHNSSAWGAKIYGLLLLLIAGIGASISSRQLWLQSLPPEEMPACGPGLDYMLETFPLFETIATVFRGSGDCGEVLWTFLGLSIPGWTLLAFIGLGLVGLVNNWIWKRT